MSDFEVIGLLVKGDLPKTCGECPLLLTGIDTDGAWGIDYCVFLKEDLRKFNKRIDKMTERPAWCPITDDLSQITVKVMNNLKIYEIVEKKK